MKTFGLVAAILTLSSLSPAAAAPAQTAEGAQKFLAATSQSGVKAYVSGQIKVKHLCTKNNVPWFDHCAQFKPEMTRRYDWSLQSFRQGATACQTIATSGPVQVNVHDVTDTSWLGTVVHKFSPIGDAPILTMQIDWGKAVVKRGGWIKGTFYLAETVWNPNATNNISVEQGDMAISFVSDEPDMLDRIEYAMKFLKLSCDVTADTGF